jgi:hypothetical protein
MANLIFLFRKMAKKSLKSQKLGVFSVKKIQQVAKSKNKKSPKKNCSLMNW